MTTKDHDIFLVQKLREGDVQAFQCLVNRYKDVSLTLACSILKDKALAEDVLQEVFIKVYGQINSFRQQSAFSSWLYRIVVNTAYNELKRKKINVDIAKTPYAQVVLDEKSALQKLGDRERKKYIILALNSLSPDEALALRLFYLCECSLKEIAEITGFGPSKIKVCLHRGRKNIARALKNLLGDQAGDLL